MTVAGRPGLSAREALGALALVGATLLAYLPALEAGFVWDDDTHLIDNVILQENGLARIWLRGETTNFWPITWTSYWIEHQLWGLDPRGYHATNILLHALNALLVWRLMRVLGIPGAWLGAMIFALHPMNVESVAWITQRKNLLSLTFYLVAWLAFERGESGPRRGAWLAAASGAFLLSMLSKGAGVTLPAALLLVAWWRRGRIGWSDVRSTLPLFAIAALMSGVELLFQHVAVIGGESLRPETLLDRIAAAGWVAWFYLWKTFVPIDLIFVYPRWTVDATRWIHWLPNLALVGLAGLAWRLRHTAARHPAVALAFFLGTLAPVLGIFDFFYLRYSLVADHYAYVAILGPIAWFAGGAAWLAQRAPHPARALAAGAALALLAGLLVATERSTRRFESEEILWRDTLARNPDAGLAHYNLGVLLQRQGRLLEAEEHYRENLRLGWRESRVHNNLALALCGRGACDEAILHYRAALELSPDDMAARGNLAGVLLRTGDPEGAATEYRLALANHERSAGLHAGLAQALVASGDLEAAREHAERATEIDPSHALARMTLAEVWTSLGRTGEAIRELRTLVRQRPRHAAAHRALAQRLEEQGARDRALVHYRRALALRPEWSGLRASIDALGRGARDAPAKGSR